MRCERTEIGCIHGQVWSYQWLIKEWGNEYAQILQMENKSTHIFKGFIKTKGVICMDFRVLLNIYITDNTVSKYLKQNLIRIWNTEKSTIIMQDF